MNLIFIRMTTFLFITLLSVALLGILLIHTFLKLWRQKDIIRVYDALQGRTGFNEIIDILSNEMKLMGIEVLGFFRRNRKDLILEGSHGKIPLIQKSSGGLKAFFTGKAYRADRRYEIDASLMMSFGEKRISFVPLKMKAMDHCWKKHGCNDLNCNSYGKKTNRCWTDSGKRFRNADLPSYEEKIKKCICCNSFLPVGVFAIKGRKTAHSMRFLQIFQGLIANAVMYDRAKHAATRDGLTGLLNKRSFVDNLSSLLKLSGRYNQPLSLCLFDIDHFKKFNDTYGHQTGDLILSELAGLVLKSVRETDLVCRYGGEEFTIIFPNTPKEMALDIAEKLRKQVESYAFPSKDRDLNVTISLGVASFPTDEIAHKEDLIEKADLALYHSKKTSRNKVTGFAKKMASKAP